MTRRIRRILYISFIAVFLISAPILVLYTAGYRYDTSRNRVIKTGVLTIHSQPKDALVSINGQPQQKKTPSTISRLLPGTYQVRVEKEGYIPWESNLTVTKGEVTLVSDLQLFSSNSPQLISDRSISQFHLDTQDRGYFVESTETTAILHRINLNTGEIMEMTQGANLQILASEFNQILVAYREGEEEIIAVIDQSGNSLRPLPQFTSVPSKSAFVSENSIVTLLDGKICRLEIDPASAPLNCSGNAITDFLIASGSIYTLSSQPNASVISRASINDQSVTEIAPLPLQNYELSSFRDDILTVVNHDDESIYFIRLNQDDFSISRHNSLGSQAFWLVDENRLVSYGSFEVWLVNPATEERNLITRVSDPILQAGQISDLPYIFILQGSSLSVVPIDSVGSQRKMISLVENVEGLKTAENANNSLWLTATRKNSLWRQILFTP
ncbi:MAG: PEGA domain-containing protein [bacterium]|nr:PEGA domain-containing protein [bacterium]